MPYEKGYWQQARGGTLARLLKRGAKLCVRDLGTGSETSLLHSMEQLTMGVNA